MMPSDESLKTQQHLRMLQEILARAREAEELVREAQNLNKEAAWLAEKLSRDSCPYLFFTWRKTGQPAWCTRRQNGDQDENVENFHCSMDARLCWRLAAQAARTQA